MIMKTGMDAYITELSYDLLKDSRDHGLMEQIDHSTVTSQALKLCNRIMDEVVEAADAVGDSRLHLAEELSDVIIMALVTAAHEGIDIGTALANKIEINHLRPYKHRKVTKQDLKRSLLGANNSPKDYILKEYIKPCDDINPEIVVRNAMVCIRTKSFAEEQVASISSFFDYEMRHKGYVTLNELFDKCVFVSFDESVEAIRNKYGWKNSGQIGFVASCTDSSKYRICISDPVVLTFLVNSYSQLMRSVVRKIFNKLHDKDLARGVQIMADLSIDVFGYISLKGLADLAHCILTEEEQEIADKYEWREKGVIYIREEPSTYTMRIASLPKRVLMEE